MGFNKLDVNIDKKKGSNKAKDISQVIVADFTRESLPLLPTDLYGEISMFLKVGKHKWD